MALIKKKDGKAGGAMELDAMLGAISSAVSNANRTVEMEALHGYLDSGFQSGSSDGLRANGNPDGVEMLPLSFNMTIGEKKHTVPVSALLHNTSMRLDQVDMTVRFRLSEAGGKLMAICTDGNDDGKDISEMKLSFKNAPSSEGMARISSSQIRQL